MKKDNVLRGDFYQDMSGIEACGGKWTPVCARLGTTALSEHVGEKGVSENPNLFEIGPYGLPLRNTPLGRDLTALLFLSSFHPSDVTVLAWIYLAEHRVLTSS